MVEEQTMPDQSDFIESQSLLQAPPSPLQQVPEPQKKKRILIVALVFVFVVLMGIMAVLPKKRILPTIITPSPEPSPITSTSQKQQVIDQITSELKLADPETVLLPPPQVDMNVEF